jgi:hypothetical protein
MGQQQVMVIVPYLTSPMLARPNQDGVQVGQQAQANCQSHHNRRDRLL